MAHPESSGLLAAYVDASFTRLAAGGGYVARRGDRMLIGAFPLHGMTNSSHAEAAAAHRFVEMAMAGGAPPRRIDIRTDSQPLVMRSSIRANVGPDDVVPMHEICERAGATLSVSFCKGHRPTGSASGFLNHCADRLAALGALGEPLAWEVPFDAFWRLRAMECHESLWCEGVGLSRLESAGYLGLGTETIDLLLRNGHVEPLPGMSRIDERSLVRVRRQLADRGVEPTLRADPLDRVRGRVDEAESGFFGPVETQRPVRMVVHLAEAGEDVAAVIALEGSGEDEIFAVRFPAGDGPPWEPVLGGMLDLARDRYPDLDRLTVVASDQGLVNALNGLGPWAALPVFGPLDEGLGKGGLSIEARPVVASWKSWQVSCAAPLLQDLLSGGAEGAWTVIPHWDRSRAPALRATDREPPWATARGCLEIAA